MYLGYVYIAIRLALVFILVPIIHLFWNKKSFGHEGMLEDTLPTFLGPIYQILRTLRSFDAEHFYYIIKNGYNNEKNTAFFPWYPMNLIFLLLPFSKNYIEIIDFVVKLALGSLTSIMIFYFSRWAMTNKFFTLEQNDKENNSKFSKMADKIAFGSALLFNFNQGLIYSVSMYSETLFTFSQTFAFCFVFYMGPEKL